MTGKKISFLALALLVPFLSSGCATARHPVPPELLTKTQLKDGPGIRVMVGEHHTPLQENLMLSVKEESPKDFPVNRDGVKIYPILAISGGGANGAYGAGLLKGWTKEGSRPVFKVVTGVSTGAIIAPFAFLGKEYDDEIEKCYTGLSTKDVMARHFPLTGIFGNSLVSNAPLAKTIRKMMTGEILDKIAVEHRRGRRLFVGTANLDAQRFVIWDMGAIACRGDAELFSKVILASAAIPVVFPPSIFKVEADGKVYDEMHADGGTLTQVFTAYELLRGMSQAAKNFNIDPSKTKSKLYVIRNGYMSPVYMKVNDELVSLAARSFEIIIDAQGVGDVYKLYVFSKEGGNDFNLAFIPPDFENHSKEMFDPKEMRRLFDRGYEDAVGGYKWHKAPPGAEEPALK
ncbi:MAG: patatin-like phospholipase family protein [Candidatus Omnitrophota bacterium]|nr:patatin-like phospholipase family protein [Candidatus Omnitrophota bacterium]